MCTLWKLSTNKHYCCCCYYLSYKFALCNVSVVGGAFNCAPDRRNIRVRLFVERVSLMEFLLVIGISTRLNLMWIKIRNLHLCYFMFFLRRLTFLFIYPSFFVTHLTFLFIYISLLQQFHCKKYVFLCLTCFRNNKTGTYCKWKPWLS